MNARGSNVDGFDPVSWTLRRLGDRDRAILDDVARLRLATGKQIQELHFNNIALKSRARVRRRVLARLVSWGVLKPLRHRRIGGIRAGSEGLIFTLDTLGRKLSHIHHGNDHRSPRDPGSRFVDHTLAISGLYVELVQLARAYGFELAAFDAEPSCWWPNGLGGMLKPDAYVKLAVSEHTDCWWLEQDMDTEDLSTIRKKLLVYLDFVRRGQAGPDNVVPRVLIAVPGEDRQADIADVIRRLPAPADVLFHVTTTTQAAAYLLLALRE